jgi:hypothetical protein
MKLLREEIPLWKKVQGRISREMGTAACRYFELNSRSCRVCVAVRHPRNDAAREVSKHLSILENAGLVRSERRERARK